MYPALYITRVHHRRFIKPFHTLSYRVAFLGFDLGETAQLSQTLKTTPYSLRPTDYGQNSWAALADAMRTRAKPENKKANGKVILITLPRLLRRGFNPVSLFLIFNSDDTPAAIVYDVRNTFGDRHYYAASLDSARHERTKQFHVSPFLDNDGQYRFNFVTDGSCLHLGITKVGTTGAELYASMDGSPRPLTRKALWRAALSLPVQGAMILTTIHWEAVKLWAKGARYFPYNRDTSAPIVTQDHSQRSQ